jgi:hypothetical protein
MTGKPTGDEGFSRCVRSQRNYRCVTARTFATARRYKPPFREGAAKNSLAMTGERTLQPLERSDYGSATAQSRHSARKRSVWETRRPGRMPLGGTSNFVTPLPRRKGAVCTAPTTERQWSSSDMWMADRVLYAKPSGERCLIAPKSSGLTTHLDDIPVITLI